MIKDLLKYEEGYREKVYNCSEGYPTIGIGTKLGPKGAPLSHYTFTVNEAVAYELLEMELQKIWNSLDNYNWYRNLDADRQTIIDSMAYQLGVTGILKFRRMITALEAKDYAEAAREALDSRWYRQTKARAIRHATVLEHGNLMKVYEGLI